MSFLYIYTYIYTYTYKYRYIYIQLPSAIPPPCLGIRRRSSKSHMTNIGPNIKQSRPTNTKICLKINQKLSKNQSTLVFKSTKIGPKIGPKINQNRSQGPLGEVWGPSWPQDGLRPPQELQNPFRLTPLGVEVGGQNRPKIDAEASQNVIIFLIIFWIDF